MLCKNDLPADVGAEGNHVTMGVQNGGPGIARERAARIFDVFFTIKLRGSGLGVASCRLIVERHGGQVRADAPKPHGARFHILPPR